MDTAPQPDLPDPQRSAPETSVTRVGEAIEVSSDGIECSKKAVKSWVEMAQDKKCLRKHDVEVLTKDGKYRVQIPGEITKDSTPLWEDFVVGKFLDLAPHIAKVHMVVNKIWRYGDLAAKVDVFDVNATMMRFKVENPKAREKILRRGMWNIAGVPMVVTKWTPKTEAEKQEEKAIPMWVHLKNVPLQMFSWETLSFMVSTVGFPVKLHHDTISCTNLEEAKVFVNVDVTKVLPKEITFQVEEKDYTVGFHYPWLPSRCNLCNKWGHVEKVCVMKGKIKKQDDMCSTSPEKVTVQESVAAKEQQSGAREESPTKGNIEEAYEQQENTPVKDSEEVNSPVADIVQVRSRTTQWSRVSPLKVGRYQTNPPQGTEDDIQISASKFSILSSNDVEEGEIMGVEKQNVEENEEVKQPEEDQESDLVEDSTLAQQVKAKDKAVMQKGMKRGQKPLAQDANPTKSTRSSRRQH